MVKDVRTVTGASPKAQESVRTLAQMRHTSRDCVLCLRFDYALPLSMLGLRILVIR